MPTSLCLIENPLTFRRLKALTRGDISQKSVQGEHMSYLPNPPDVSRLSSARGLPHSSHWGAFSVLLRDGGIEVKPHPGDPAPSPLLYNIPALVAHRARIARPMVRRGWLERGPGPDRRRGRDAFVPLDWPRALDRFLNVAGGYVRSVGSYSSGAASVILPHVIGPQEAVAGINVSWDELVSHSALVLAFGGMALKNNDVGGGGTGEHIARARLRAARRRGVEFHLIGPLRDDLPPEIEATWHPIRPGTDVALMLGIAHTLVTEELHDRPFLDRFCVGYEIFEAYLLGRSDGQPKDAAWASAICGLPANEITGLARRAAGRRTLVHLFAIAAARRARRVAGVDGRRLGGIAGA